MDPNKQKNDQGRTLLIYAGVWGVIASVHTLVLWLNFGFSSGIAITEALLFNVWFAVLGTGVYFMVRYSDLSKRSVSELIFSHLSGVSAIILLWLLPLFPLMQALFGQDENYVLFLTSSLPVRVMVGVIYYAILASLIYLVLNFRQLQKQRLLEAELKSLLKESELNMLRFQINPHFLFNCLNAVSSLTLTRPEEANAMVIKLSDFMRYSLASSGKVMSTLGDELKHCQQYLDIEQVRFGDRLQVNTEVEQDLLEAPVPAMLLQPLMENSIKHGLDQTENGIKLLIRAKKTAIGLCVEVLNPIDSAPFVQKPGTGTGLKNIRARLQNIYGRNNLLLVEKERGMFKVTINLPIHETPNPMSDH
jgi:two-component system, LytTR family, sensor kinase